jgi:signal transduction histidine kinase
MQNEQSKYIGENAENQLLKLEDQTQVLIRKWRKSVDDYGFIRFYFNGIVKEFRQLVSQILSLWDGIDEEIMGTGIEQIKNTVRQQIDAFQNSVPRESDYETVRGELDGKALIIKNKLGQFQTKIASINDNEAAFNFRQSFNDDLELEINKAVLDGKESRQFLSKIGKDLFMPIKQFLDFSETLSFSGADSEQTMHFDEINKAAQNFSFLLNDYQVFQSVTEKPESLRSADINFEDVINTVIEKYSIRSQLFNINLFYKLDDKLPSNIVANKSVLEELFYSLLENAINVISLSNPLLDSEGGKINLRISIEEMANHRVKMRIAVEDSGIGFPSGKISDAFNFFSLYSEVHPFAPFKLKLCQDLVNHLNGDICTEVKQNLNAFVVDLEFDHL